MLSAKVNSVTIPSFEGEMTILSDHISLITILRPGVVKVNGDKASQYFLEEGTIEFSNNNLTILSSTIIEFSNLSGEKISEMIEDGKNQLGLDDDPYKKTSPLRILGDLWDYHRTFG